jgi:formiminoglutamase
VLEAGAIPFVVGGGNDQSYANARAWLGSNFGPLSVINVDAHLDVRPLKEGRAHSGSPFRLLLEDPRFAGGGAAFLEFAAQGAQCSAQHAAWLQERGSRIMWLSEIRRKGVGAAFDEALASLSPESWLFVSFDLDAVVGCDAPGVSAPGVVGLTSAEALQICFAAGAHPRVRLFDLSEYNPLAEPGADGIMAGYRTGKLVAAMFYHFLLGLATRTKK